MKAAALRLQGRRRSTVLTIAMLRWSMPVRFQKSGCLWSIVASIFLTIVLNLMLRACSGGPAW